LVHNTIIIFVLSVETLPEVEDSLCVGQMNSDGEERVILFLKLTEGSQLSNELVCKVKGAIRFQLTPRHVPAVIMEAPDIPVSFIFEFCSL
jgi:acetoacetyl-CoA synthetase